MLMHLAAINKLRLTLEEVDMDVPSAKFNCTFEEQVQGLQM